MPNEDKNWIACVQDRGKWKDVVEKDKTFKHRRKFSAKKKEKEKEKENEKEKEKNENEKEKKEKVKYFISSSR